MTGPGDDLPVDVASPACAMREADDAYMGFAGREELIGFLAGLLAAEREGSPWRPMLARHVDVLGGTAAAVSDQAPAVDRLRAMLPRVRDDRLHADLSRMLAAHEAASGESRRAR